MSHLRDLQRLRNPKKNFQIKSNNNQNNEQNKIQKQKSLKRYQKNQEPIKQQLFAPLLIEIQPEYQPDTITKYLQSKQIICGNQNKGKNTISISKINQKIGSNHKRGNSIGAIGNIGNRYYDIKSRQMMQSGLAVYNFSLKVSKGNIADPPNQAPPPQQTSGRRSNIGHIEKESDLIVDSTEYSPTLRNSHGGNKIKRGTKVDLKINLQGNNIYNIKQNDNYLMGKQSFEIICPVGKGGFGKVWKVKYKKTAQIFAMKEMQKIKIINKKSINSVMNERFLLAELEHPFLVNMKSSFQDRENLYLVIDYLNGGDLRYHIGCKGKFNQVQTKFFIANILIGLQYLHSHKILHRDLKPQNFVLDSQGYLRITDLGVARLLKTQNYKDTSGTPGYMSPQVICHKNHAYTTDYFALGVIGYEFMLGRRPYNGRNRKQIRQHILTKQVQIKIDQLPYKWSPKSADFINHLLQRNPEKRLGRNGIQEIKKHPWLSDIDWKSIKDKTLKSPYIPMTMEQNYQDYREQISQDTIDENQEQTKMLLRDHQVQELFQGYQFNGNAKSEGKKSLRSTNGTDADYLSLRSSCK